MAGRTSVTVPVFCGERTKRQLPIVLEVTVTRTQKPLLHIQHPPSIAARYKYPVPLAGLSHVFSKA
jgi:hypothetical protein